MVVCRADREAIASHVMTLHCTVIIDLIQNSQAEKTPMMKKDVKSKVVAKK